MPNKLKPEPTMFPSETLPLFTNEQFNPDMIKLARDARDLTQAELCERMGVTQGTVSKIENRLIQFSPELAARASEALDYPVSFFEQKNPIFPRNTIYFRSGNNKRLPAKTFQYIEAKMNIVRLNIERLLGSVESPPVRLFDWDVEKHGSPEKAAQSLRQLWNVPRGPIAKLIRLVENNGVIVVAFDFNTDEVDGLSMYTTNGIPIVCYNANLKGDRQRFTVAHEVGHLVMHFGQLIAESRDIEGEAFSFAAEFLVPEAEFVRSFGKFDLQSLAILKRYWLVSMAALIVKADKRKLVSSNQIKNLWRQMAMHNWRKVEPPALDIPVEESAMLREIIEVYQSELGYSLDEVARVVHLTTVELRQSYFNDPKPRFRVIRNTEPPHSPGGGGRAKNNPSGSYP